MSDALSVDLRALEQLMVEMSAAAGRIADKISTLDSDALSTRSLWGGDASNAYQGAHSRWTADMERMRNALHDLRQVVALARSNYSSAVEANSAMWHPR